MDRRRRGVASRVRVGTITGSAVRMLVVVAMVATGFVTSVAVRASATSPTLDVKPGSGLVDGQTVMVSGTGWIPGHRVVLCESGNEGADVVAAAAFDWCAGVVGMAVTVDTAGNFSTSVVMSAQAYVPSFSAFIDCTDPTNHCFEGATDRSVANGTSTAVNVSFALMCVNPLVANPHTSVTFSDGHAIGSVATFVADPGYVLVGQATSTCTIHEWTSSPPTALFTGSPVVVPGSASVREGYLGTTALNVPVTLSQGVNHTVTVQWKTVFVPGASGDQADPASDYTPASGTVTFTPGAVSRVVTIRVNGDTLVEPDEYIVVQFGNATRATIGGFYGLGVGVITNDDGLPVIVPGSASVLEGNSGFTWLSVPVSLSAPSTRAVTVDWHTVFVSGAPGNQADPNSDYLSNFSTVVFAPGVTTAVAMFQIRADTQIEPDEYVILRFGNPTNANVGGTYGLGAGIILNDDGTPTVQVTPSTGLVDGQAVAITGSGWTPGHKVALCEGGNEGGGGDDGTGCNNGPHALVTVDNAGNISGSIVITRDVFVPTLTATIDCTDPFFQCWAGAADSLHLTAAVGRLIFFASP